MENNIKPGLIERLAAWLCRGFADNRLPFLSALIFGLAAHGFMLTNKIPYGDDLVAMFDKGATTVSGRYGLELMRLIMPDVSMPWIYGLLTLLVLAVTSCLILKIFRIQSLLFRLLIPGVFVSFPAQAATMNYTFTVLPYALAMCCTVLGVYLFASSKRGRWLAAPLLIAFSCSIYQGYFSLASSFCIILMIQALLQGEKDAIQTIRYGFELLAMLLLSLAVYGLAIVFFSMVLDLPLISEVVNDKQSIVLRVAVAYSAYLKTIFAGYFGYVHSGFSLVMHLLLIIAAAVGIFIKMRSKPLKSWLLVGFCLFLFPLSCYCLYMLADNSYIHALALYSFASLYILCAIVLDDVKLPLKNAAAFALLLIMCGNVYFANALYLRNHLKFEAVKSFYTGLVTQVISCPGFDENTELAVLGTAPALVYDVDEFFPFEKMSTPSHEIGSTAYTELIINRYLGFDLPFADEETAAELSISAELEGMSVYPYDGSVKKIGDCIVVKFAE